MQIRPIGMPVNSSLRTILCIVAMPFEHFTQGFRCTEIRSTSVIFKTYQCTTVPGNSDISNATRNMDAFMNRPCIKNAQSAHIDTTGGPVVVRKQLVSTTDRQHGHIVLNSRPQADTLHLVQVLRHRSLLFILTSTNKQEIVFIGGQRIPDAQADHAQPDTAQLAASLQSEDIPSITV